MRGRKAFFFAVLATTAAMIATLVAFRHELTPSELPGLVLGTLALFVALVTLWYVVPTPAQILVVRQDELELDDVIFFVYDEPEGRVPRDYLVQLHVAVANVGGRKAVISRVRLDGLMTQGGTVDPVLCPPAFGATKYRMTGGWENGQFTTESAIDYGPWVLEPDDVITLRFRHRGGIDWSDVFDLQRLHQIYDALAEPIDHSAGSVEWRAGASLRSKPISRIQLRTVQQAAYRQALYDATRGLTHRPMITPRPITD